MKDTKTQKLVKDSKQLFQEFQIKAGKIDRENFDIQTFRRADRPVLLALSSGRGKEDVVGFGVMFLGDQDISCHFAKIGEDNWLEQQKNNSKNEKMFFGNNDFVRRVACSKAMAALQKQALEKNAVQSCLFYDVNQKGDLELRGGLMMGVKNEKICANVFLDTRICEFFDKKLGFYAEEKIATH